MPNWSAVLREIQIGEQSLDNVRVKYMRALHEKTGRNVIAYYSGWLQRGGIGGIDITDLDKNGFMNAVHEIDRSLGLDLILHTPGGDVAATESLVDYLHQMFGSNIRAIIPQIAMSAGTMMACACRSILMGKESNLGPIDPKYSGIPAAGVVEEFNRAIFEVKKDPGCLPIWKTIIERYHPTFIGQCEKAVRWSEEIVKKWLEEGMFAGHSDAQARSQYITEALIAKGHQYNHSAHISTEQCKALGLKIENLEEDDALQDIVLTIHHAFMHTFSQATRCLKIVENHKGNRIINFVGTN